MNPHAQQVADLEALTADYFAPTLHTWGSRRRPDQVAYVLRHLDDIEIMSLVNQTYPKSAAIAYAAAVGRSLSAHEQGHLYVQQIGRGWKDLPIQAKIARLRHFHSHLELAW